MKPAKQEKQIPASKLPGLFKKSYTQKNFEKKILNHLYIDADRQLILSLFQSGTDASGTVCIPPDTVLPKSEFKHLRLIASQIKRQKGRFNLIPLAAVIIFIAGIGITVTLFKNTFVRRAIISGMENAFGAKTDIASVQVQIFGSSLQIHGLQQADKNKPMTNLFQIDNITVDFNLTELLRGKFDAQDIGVTGVALGTPRKTSGTLPARKTVKKTQQDNAFVTLAKEKAGTALDNAKASLVSTFNQYNPQTVLSGLQSRLKSPQAAQDIQTKVAAMIPAWKDKPAEFETSIQTFTGDAQDLINTDWSRISDAATLTAALEKTQKAINEGKELKTKTEQTLAQLKADTATVKSLSSELESAVKSDKALAQAELDKIKSFSIDGTKKLISTSLDSAAYSALGKYYPYLQQALVYAEKLKNSSSSAKTDKKTVKTSRRLKGRMVYYKADRVPSFLIEKAEASSTAFSIDAKEISNDPDLRGSPAYLNGKLFLDSHNHTVKAVIDGRSSSKAPLLTAVYSGSNYSIAADIPVLSMNADADISGTITADTDGSFAVKGTMDMKTLQLTADDFEPQFACTIYKKALSSLKTMKIDASAAYSRNTGISLSLSADADKRFAESLKALMNAELSSIKDSAQKEISGLLAEKTAGASEQIRTFLGLDSTITCQTEAVDAINRKLLAKQDEIKNQIQREASEKIKSTVPDSVKNVLKGLF